MGRLVKIHNGEVLVAYNYVHTPEYSLYVANYVGGATPPHGWKYFADDLTLEDFAPLWKQPTGAQDAYALGAEVQHAQKRWRSLILGNVWEPGVSGWIDTSTSTPAWIQPTGAHDAYVKGAVVSYGGSLWASLVDANVWQPGVSNWREASVIAPDGTVAVAAWVQPTGAQDAYPLGARVTHNGQTWESTAADNVWEPGVFGWVVV